MNDVMNKVENVMENNELVQETIETGAEIVTKVVKDHSTLKRVGKATGVAVLGVLVYEVAIKPAVNCGKKKFNDWRKKKVNKSEGSEEETVKNEAAENIGE